MSNGIGMGKDTQEALSGSFDFAIRLFCDGLKTVIKLVRKGSLYALRQTIDHCYGEDKLKPYIKPVENTDTREIYSVNIPAGLGFDELERLEDKFTVATGHKTEVNRNGNRYTIEVIKGTLPNRLQFDLSGCFDDLKGFVPAYLGKSIVGDLTVDLSDSPHWLVAGNTGMGKSNFVHVLLNSMLLSKADIRLNIIDFKRLEFSYLKLYGAKIVWDDKGALELLTRLNNELDKRLEILERAGVVKVQEYDGTMPFEVLLIDELAEMDCKESQSLLNRLLRLGRAGGFCVICATQRPSADLFKQFSNSRALFGSRVCFGVESKEDSRIAGVVGAEEITVKGRAIVSLHEDIEIQVPYLPIKQAKKILAEQLEAKKEDCPLISEVKFIDNID